MPDIKRFNGDINLSNQGWPTLFQSVCRHSTDFAERKTSSRSSAEEASF